jgi:FixJ family two-component response regulator
MHHTPPIAKKRLIAVIDDDHHAREGMDAYIKSCGLDCATFRTAEEYLSSGCPSDASCLIVDVHLPGMTGFDLQEQLIEDDCRVPIIFVTGLFDETICARVLRAGAFGYLTKPCCGQSLIDCVERALITTINRQ